MATSGHVPHRSRWEKSATTFGPTGRVAATVILLSTLLPAISYANIVYVLTFPVAAAVMLKAIWAKGWVVPDEPDLPPLPVDEPPPPEPLTTAMRTWRIATWTLGLGALLLFAYGPVPAKAAVLALAAIVLPWWFFRRFLDR
jgi:DMSO reductase anchor subunit